MDDLTSEVRRRQAAKVVKPKPPAGSRIPEERDALIRATAGELRPQISQQRRRGPHRETRVGCMMMQKDEGELLDPWLRYHGWLFGAENLTVLDNGSTHPDVLARLEQAEADGVTVVRAFSGRDHFEDKGRVFRGLVRKLEAALDYDFFMPLDCDEFVAFMEPDGRVLCERDAVTDRLRAEHLNEPRAMFIRGSFFNVVGQPGAYSFRKEPKCFFARDSIGGLSMGFHQGSGRATPGQVQTGVVHFHYRYRPYDQYIRSAKAKLSGRVDAFEEDAVKASRRSGGSHMARLAFLEEAEYMAHFAGKMDCYPIDSLKRAFAELGMPLPF